ncbi:hypothetical protein NP493_98g03018 [Ridgeia piscesae]|uniref:G-protein coupled receptors family 1 profile domain-containing protein n=1 Tax=Ridgeia piscesae TaxID=27915 RepID=A0AAD9P864_RIDPI|nr:hypothetical protein NP493_98g03018 [Ridgeia piscesae]
MFLQCLLAAVGLHTLVAISHERLLLIVYPLWARSVCTTARARRLLAVVWVCAVACLLPIPLRYTVLQPSRARGVRPVLQCVVFAWSTADIVYLVVICVFYFVLPLLALSLAYARIFTALYRWVLYW